MHPIIMFTTWNMSPLHRTYVIPMTYDKPLRGTGRQKHSKPVMWRADGSQSWTTCESMTQAAQQLGVSNSTISKWCKTMSSSKGIEFKSASLMDEHIPGEEWRQMRDPRTGRAVPGRMVSSLGRLKFLNGRISLGYLENIGYLSTTLSWDFGRQFERVHRLVAAAFLGDPPTPMHTQVNHKHGLAMLISTMIDRSHEKMVNWHGVVSRCN